MGIFVLTTEIYQAVGHEFNLNSTKQLGDVLFKELKLPTGRKTKTGGNRLYLIYVSRRLQFLDGPLDLLFLKALFTQDGCRLG